MKTRMTITTVAALAVALSALIVLTNLATETFAVKDQASPTT